MLYTSTFVDIWSGFQSKLFGNVQFFLPFSHGLIDCCEETDIHTACRKSSHTDFDDVEHSC